MGYKTSQYEPWNETYRGRRMIKPTIEEVAEYIKQEGYFDVNPEKWWNYYEAIGWKIGKKPMVQWRSAVATWTKTTKEQRLKHKNKKCACGCGRQSAIVIDGKVYASERCYDRIKFKNQPTLPNADLDIKTLTQSITQPIPDQPKRKPMYQQVQELLKKEPIKPYVPLTAEQLQERKNNARKLLLSE